LRITSDAVARETPAARATSSKVTRPVLGLAGIRVSLPRMILDRSNGILRIVNAIARSAGDEIRHAATLGP
jgi:hypothetical protein